MDNKISRKTFCVLPWIHSFVNSNGAYQVCCTSEEHHKGIPDQNNVNYNITNRPSVLDVMNADLMKNLRLQMLSGEWSEICTRCFETERFEGVSRRLIENKEHRNLIDELIAETKPDGSIDPKFKSLDYRLGNLCNLQCRMCGPFSSEKWLKDWNDVKPETEHLDHEHISYYQNFKWTDNSGLIEEFAEKIDKVERIHFAGGEPLLSPQMSKLLKSCISLGVAKKISISYNTNITVLPKDVLDLWKEFKEVRLLCSVDGFGEVNDYIRPPSKWDVVNKNLHYLDQYSAELKITEILLSCTVQVYNILTLNELYRYVSEFKFITPALNLINLHFPDYLSTQILPKEAKVVAEKRLLEVVKSLEGRLSEDQEYLISNIYQIINRMNEKDLSHLLVKFKKFNSKFDAKKKTKMSHVLPELNSYLIKYYVDNVLGT